MSKPKTKTEPKPYVSCEKERQSRATGRNECLEPSDVEPRDAAKWDEARFDASEWAP